jgi:carboxypeptidase C (cathepsin A)
MRNVWDYALMTFAMSGTALITAADYTPEALADQILNLPGTENLEINFNQFSGYVKVSETKNLHYWFVESQNDPVNDPIAFWTNGGPGCSGLYGFLTENGPFSSVNSDLTLSLNPYSWNRIANMVFIEQPCGVGFSYSDQESPYDSDGGDYVTNDEQAAKDNYQIIQQFFNRYPQYRTNNLYIASESYGGHYMPQLSQEIVNRNTAGNDPLLNFKGMMVGNPGTTSNDF